MHTADDDSVPIPHDAFRLPRAVLNWKTTDARSVAVRRQRAERESERRPVSRADELEDEPTRMIQVPILPHTPARADAVQVLLDAARARASELWRNGPLRTAAMLGAVSLITYLAVGGVRNGGRSGMQTAPAPAAALPAVSPIIVEQLNGARQPRETVAAPLRGEQSDKPRSRSASDRTHETSFSAAPVSKSGYQTVPPQSKSKARRAQRSSASASSSSPGLPAWGAEAVREFSGAKSSKSATVTSRSSQALTAKPSGSNADIPPPMAAYRSTAKASAPAREPSKPVPVVAAKPVELAKPIAPPRPSKPLTMDQVLNQVEEAAKVQRKQAGLKAPKTSKRDAELDELISGSMKSKSK